MHHKLARLFVACALSAALAGCKRDALIESVLNDLHTFTQEVVKRVDGAPDPSAGVDDAQKYFDSRKAEIQDKLQSIKGIHGFQVSQETQKKMTEQLTDDAVSVSQLQNKYMTQALRDPAFRQKLSKLITDYANLLRSATQG
jgi:coenzyme F420-reducing hydrogenase beta subunit